MDARSQHTPSSLDGLDLRKLAGMMTTDQLGARTDVRKVRV